MIREALIGAAAGAIGTVAFNVTTYTDMALRGRAASSVPSEAAGRLAEKLGIDLSAEGEEQDGPTAQNRQSGLGALQGYFVGLSLGAAYGLVRTRLGDMPVPLAGLVWYSQVGLIVAGHVVAVYLAHLVSLRYFGSAKRALRSQYPVLALMTFYTIFSLWILSQPIVE